MRVLVCGGRAFDDAELVERTLNAIRPPISAIIQGGAEGADHLAALWADSNLGESEVYRAEWNLWGRGAGPRRNQRMLDEGKPDLVVAFSGGRGTADMVRRARKAGVKVMEVA